MSLMSQGGRSTALEPETAKAPFHLVLKRVLWTVSRFLPEDLSRSETLKVTWKILKSILKLTGSQVRRHQNWNYVVLIPHFEPFAAYELIPDLYLSKAQLW